MSYFKAQSRQASRCPVKVALVQKFSVRLSTITPPSPHVSQIEEFILQGTPLPTAVGVTVIFRSAWCLTAVEGNGVWVEERSIGRGDAKGRQGNECGTHFSEEKSDKFGGISKGCIITSVFSEQGDRDDRRHEDGYLYTNKSERHPQVGT